MTTLRRWLLRLLLVPLGVVLLLFTGCWIASQSRESKSRAEAAGGSGRFLRAADVELHIQEAGPADGPTVVMIHGTGAWSEIWRETITALTAAGYRSVAIDLPPFGFSERPANANYGDEAQAARILGILEGLDLHGVTLVGHSFGARPTVTAALRALPRIRNLVLIDPALGIRSGDAMASVLPLPLRAIVGTPILRDPLIAATLTNPILTKMLLRRLILDPADATDHQVELVQRQFAVDGTTHALGAWLRAFLSDAEAAPARDLATYRQLPIPTLLLWGAEDAITPLDQSTPVLDALPHASLVVLEKTGHIPMIENVAAVNAALLHFLSQQQPAATN